VAVRAGGYKLRHAACHDKTNPVDHFRRIGALRRKLTRAGLPGLLVTHLPDIRYLSGFTGSSAALAVTRRAARLFTDGRYTAQAKEEVEAAQVQIVSASPAVAAVQWLAAQPGVGRSGFDPARTTVAELARWKSELPGKLRRSFLEAIPAPYVEQLRIIKDEDELALMAEAALLGCQLFDRILKFLRPGIAEMAVAAEMEHQARMLGAEAMSGIILRGYCSDMTRTVYLGTPGPAERKAYNSVLEAQEAAVAAAVPGASCAEVDEAARSILRREGLGEAFSHSTGHGVGLEIHEPPRVGAGQSTRLVPGMVVTIEPGVYLAGQFGIRIEDMVAITRTGNQVLTPEPKALIEL
jgi:Xaa-Pro aminopeptidase